MHKFQLMKSPALAKLATAMIVLAVMVAAATYGITRAYASTPQTLCSGYSSCSGVGYTDHGYGAVSSQSFWGDTDTQHNCTNYVAYVEQTQNGIPKPSFYLGGTAAQWWSASSPYVHESTTTPVVGSVAWWNSTSILRSGHVAYVEAVSGGSGTYTITISEDAYPNGPYDWKRISQGSAGWPGGFIYFANLTDSRLLGAAAHSNGEQDVFWRGANGDLQETYYAGGWHGPMDIGMGPLGSAPTAVVRPGTNEQDVFWKGTDGNLWEAYWNGSWHGSIYLGMGPLGSQPSAAAWGTEIDVFWRGTDNNLWEAWQTSTGWHGPSLVGMGPLGSTPTAAAHSSGEQDVFWKGTDGSLWETYYAGGWHGPIHLGMGPLGSAPTTSVQPATGQEDVFWVGTDNNIWHAYWSGSWHGPNVIGMGPLSSSPSVAAWGTEIDLFWGGMDADLWESWGSTSTWHGPTSLGMRPLAGA